MNPTSVRTTQTERAYEALRRMLLNGEIPSGTRLTELVWTGRLGVVRGALRSALGLLAHEGLLARGARGGFFVPQYSQSDVDQILEVRLALEVTAIEMAGIRGVKPGTCKALRTVCKTMRMMIDQGFDLGFIEADRRFHDIIVEMGQNPRLMQVHDLVPTPLLRTVPQDTSAHNRHLEITLGEHEELCAFIEANEFKRAMSLMRQHLTWDHSFRDRPGQPLAGA